MRLSWFTAVSLLVLQLLLQYSHCADNEEAGNLSRIDSTTVDTRDMDYVCTSTHTQQYPPYWRSWPGLDRCLVATPTFRSCHGNCRHANTCALVSFVVSGVPRGDVVDCPSVDIHNHKISKVRKIKICCRICIMYRITFPFKNYQTVTYSTF